MADWVELLGKADLFRAAGAKEREALAARAREIKVERREGVASPAPSSLYVAMRGEFKLVRGNGAGPRLLYEFAKAGDVWGEEAVIFSDRHDLTAVALSPASALAIPAEDVRALLDDQPRLARALAALCASRSRAMRERLYLNAACPVAGRVAWALANLAHRFGRRDGRGTIIEIRFTHQDLADYVGASRETVTMVLGRLKKDGITSRSGRRLALTDLNRLKKLSAERIND